MSTANHTRPAALFVLEDDRGPLQELQQTLRDDGYQLFHTRDPWAALDLCAREAVGVVLCDLDNQALGGLSLLREIKSRHPQILQVVLSAQTDFAAAMEAINKLEVHRFITKPFDPRALRVTIKAALNSLGPRRKLAAMEIAAKGEALWAKALEDRYPGLWTPAATEGGVVRLEEPVLEIEAERAPAWLRKMLVEP
jgi:DNA-binding NtrC family response regulator